MKILRLDLRAFGPFTDVSLDLSGGSQGLHVIYGRNEAGKTSALRALRQLFYGIPGNSTDHFVHKYEKLRIGALLSRSDGTQLEILRRKGLKGTLLAPDNKTPIDEAELHRFLGSCDQTQFETMFGIDHAALVAGGLGIIRGEGEVGHVLFAAGAGIADLRSVRTSLEQEADALFKPAASKPAINQSLSALGDARKRVRDAQLPSAEWTTHRQAHDEATGRLAELEPKLQELSRQKARLERLTAALPAIGRLKQTEQAQAAYEKVPLLAEGFPDRRREAVGRLEIARKSEQDAAEEIDGLDRQMERLVVPENVLAEAEAIETIYRELSVYRKAQTDLPAIVAKREQFNAAAAEILHDLRPDLTLDEVSRLRLGPRQQVEIQDLASRKSALEKQLAQARAEIADGTGRLAEAVEQLDNLPPPRDVRPLAEAIRQVQADGNLSQQAAALRKELTADEQQAEVGLRTLGLWQGTLDALETLPLPTGETIDRFDRELADALAAIGRLEENLDAARSEAQRIQRDIEQLRREGDVPSEDDLAAARRLRDLGWRLVLQDWRHEALDAAERDRFLQAMEPARDLAEAFEQAVRRTDELADRLRREAARVANRAALEASEAGLQRQIRETGDRLDAARTVHERLTNDWAEGWRPLRIEPLPPHEMRAWVRRQQALAQQAQAIRQRRAALEQLDARIAAHAELLQSRLDANPGATGILPVPGPSTGKMPVAPDVGRIGNPSHPPSDPLMGRIANPSCMSVASVNLPALLARAEDLRAEIESEAETRRQLNRDVAALRRSMAAAQAKADQAGDELSQWQAQWATAIEPLGLGPDTAPSVVNEMLVRTGDLFTRLNDARRFTERIEAIEADGQRFRQDVQRLVERIDPNHGDEPLDHQRAVEELFARLRRATAEQKQLALLRGQRSQQEQKQCQARETAAEMEARLRVLCDEAGCRRPEELPEAERASAEAARLRRQWDDCREELLRLSAGETIETLMADAEAVHADELPERLRQLADAMAELHAERDKLLATIAVEKTELERMDPGAAAADAAEEVQSLLARIEPDVRHYVRLRLAAAVLREGIQRYRKRNEGPVLTRASELFRHLTLGSFTELWIDFNDRGEQVLAGVRAGGDSILPAAMSEGTADQLYLALRLASLETWLQRNEAIPFIVDDILVSFDNPRAAAALEVFAELSQKTQVIFFAHHEHLVELATQAVTPEALFIHRL